MTVKFDTLRVQPVIVNASCDVCDGTVEIRDETTKLHTCKNCGKEFTLGTTYPALEFIEIEKLEQHVPLVDVPDQGTALKVHADTKAHIISLNNITQGVFVGQASDMQQYLRELRAAYYEKNKAKYVSWEAFNQQVTTVVDTLPARAQFGLTRSVDTGETTVTD
jgi:hypothetical protein